MNWLCMVNLYAFRATDPADMKKAADPVGPENNDHITQCICEADLVIAAWGIHGAFKNRPDIMEACSNLGIILDVQFKCLGTNKDGSPKHPLYIKGNTELRDYPDYLGDIH